jgi:hypothetical protein
MASVLDSVVSVTLWFDTESRCHLIFGMTDLRDD